MSPPRPPAAENAEKRPARAFELCLGRAPDAAEAKLATEFFAAGEKEDQQKLLSAYCQALLAAAEFRNVD